MREARFLSDGEIDDLSYRYLMHGADLSKDADMKRLWNPLRNAIDSQMLQVKLLCDDDFEIKIHNEAFCIGSDKLEYSLEVPFGPINKTQALQRAIALTAAVVYSMNDPEIVVTERMPEEWKTEKAATCFARSYDGEGSYYCPSCDSNQGSVWLEDSWRPTKEAALCEKCRSIFGLPPRY